MRRRVSKLSRWLREVDGSTVTMVEKESGLVRSELRGDGNGGRDSRDRGIMGCHFRNLSSTRISGNYLNLAVEQNMGFSDS